VVHKLAKGMINFGKNIQAPPTGCKDTREFVQKPHEPHAAFVHCAKPRDKMKNL
jgi:hypothetical protein